MNFIIAVQLCYIHTMHVSLMFIFNEGVTSGFVDVYIMDNMNLQ